MSETRTKYRATLRIESALLQFAGIKGDGSVPEILDEAGIGQRWFVRLVASTRIRLASEVVNGRVEFTRRLKEVVAAAAWPDGRPRDPVPIRTPTERSWASVPATEAPANPIRAATVHSVKGQEFAAVLLSIPKRLRRDSSNLTVLDHWEQDLATEARRVLYVGASRPTDLLALSISTTAKEQVVRILTERAIEYVELSASQ